MRALAFTILLLIAGCSPAPNGDYSAISRELQAGDENFYLLGSATIGPKNDLPNRIISQSEYNQMNCLVTAGYLRFAKDGSGDDGEIVTEMTSDGEATLKMFRETDTSKRYEATRVGLDLFKVRLTKTTIEKVTSDREVKKDSGRYRVVELTAATAVTGDGKLYFKVCPTELGEDHWQVNMRVLLKWDAAKSVWVFKAIDSGGGLFGYSTDRVGEALKGL